MGRPKKDRFADLDQDFQDAVHSMNEVEIRQRISKVALDQVALLEAKENDQDYQEKKEAFSVAGEVYRDGTKMNKIRIQFCKQALSDKGKAVGSFGEAA